MPHGDTHWNRKLSLFQIPAIKEMYKTGGYSQESLAKLFGVHRWTISDVIKEKTWIVPIF